ncbi:MAG TPA: hypothetical protein DCR94_02540 [Firmicutes bacterium]|nr:hypothetical protein [Bacillota bacterium]
MKNKIPSAFKDSLSFDWWKYLISFLAICVCWYYVYKTKDALKDYEIISIYSIAALKETDFSSGLLKIHEGHGIEQIDFNSIGDDNYTETLLQSKAFLDGDLLLVYDKYVDDVVKAKSYPFSIGFVNEIKAISPNISFLEYGGSSIGIKVYGIDDDQYNSKLFVNSIFDFKENTYLFINKSSSNANLDLNSKYGSCAFESFLYLLKGIE